MLSLSYFAPVGDMALRFDAGVAASARLPDGLLAGGNGFAMACWMTHPGGDKTDCCAVVVGNNTGGVAFGFMRSRVVLMPFTGPADGSGTLEYLAWGPGYDQVAEQSWLYVAVSTTKPGWLRMTAIGDGPPMGQEAGGRSNTAAIEGCQHATLVNLGQTSGDWLDNGGLTPYRGAIARLRLWRKAMSMDELLAARFDLPVVPNAGTRSDLVADWRMTEGHGDVAYDHAAPMAEHLRSRLGSPPGNHLRFARGNPTWIVANLPTPPHRTTAP